MHSSFPFNDRLRLPGIALLAALALISAGSAVASADSALEMASDRVPLTREAELAEKAARNAAKPLPEAIGPINDVAVSSAYGFGTSTVGSLTDMSSGTTTLLIANSDDTASAITGIGFDFFFQGVRYTQFSVNTNGLLRLGATVVQNSTPYRPLGQAGIPLISAFGADQRTAATGGKVHYKVIGTSPSRTLVVEWLNMQSTFNSAGTADLTYQVRLSETTGVIEFVYGSMTMSALGAADTNSNGPHIGFSSGNTAGTIGTVTASLSGTPTPTFDGNTATVVANAYTAAGAIPVLTSAADGSRRVFTLTPPVPDPATGLTFTGVTHFTTTLNWTDSANEDGYVIYRSTDGVNFVFDGVVAENATNYGASGLLPNVTYFWRVHSFSEGALGNALAGSQATLATGSVTSTGTGGAWSSPTTWAGGAVPLNTDDVTIVAGATVTIDTTAVAYTVTVSGSLVWDAGTARTLTVGSNVTVNSGGSFASAASGAITTHVLSLGGNLTNNGTLDFSTNGNTAGATVTFTGATDATFGGTGAVTDLRALVVNKGTSNTPILELNPTNLSVQGVSTDVAGFVTLTNDTLKISGSYPVTNRLFGTAAYTIGATTGLWLNNPNLTVAGQNGSPTLAGRLRISQGTLNIGTATGNSMGFSAGANITVEGGSVNAAGRFGVAAAATAITYTQTAGTITVCTIGNASTTVASFDLGTASGSIVSLIGGTIVCQLASTAASGPRDYRNQAGTLGTLSTTGGTLQFGNAASGAAKSFNLVGVVANLVVTNTSANHSVTFNTPAVFNNISRDITVATGATLNIGNQIFLFNGTSFVLDGTLTATGASSNFTPFNVDAPVTISGTGAFTVPVTGFSTQAAQGLTIHPSFSQIVCTAIRVFTGGFTNANKFTVGNGGATTGTIQIGNTTTATDAGSFDVAPTFNLGTGGQNLSYLRTTTSRTTGLEVNPTRVLNQLNRDDNDPSHTLTIAGGDLTMTSILTGSNSALGLTNGRIVTGANTLILSNGASNVNRVGGVVEGNLRKVYAAAGGKTSRSVRPTAMRLSSPPRLPALSRPASRPQSRTGRRVS